MPAVPVTQEFQPHKAFSSTIDLDELNRMIGRMFRQSAQSSYFCDFFVSLQNYLIESKFTGPVAKIRQKETSGFFKPGAFEIYITHLPPHISLDSIPHPLEPLPVDITYEGMYTETKKKDNEDKPHLKIIFSFKLAQASRSSVSVRPKKSVVVTPESSGESEDSSFRSASPNRSYSSSSEEPSEEEPKKKRGWISKLLGGKKK